MICKKIMFFYVCFHVPYIIGLISNVMFASHSTPKVQLDPSKETILIIALESWTIHYFSYRFCFNCTRTNFLDIANMIAYCKSISLYLSKPLSFLILISVSTHLNWLYVIIMSRTHFGVNQHSVVAWMSGNSLRETGVISKVLSDCNGNLTYNQS